MADNIEHQDKGKLVANCDQLVVVDNIESLIKVIRDQQVMLDRDLAHFTVLKQSVLMSK